MVFGAGRLLFRALLGARSILGLLMWSVLVRIQNITRSDNRRLKRLAIATLAVAILGPGQPVIDFVASGIGERTASAVGEPSSDPGFSMWPFDGGAPAVGPLETRAQAAPPSPAPARQKRTALIIGINKASRGRWLPGSITDAHNVRSALVAYGFPKKNITLLTDGAASRTAILREIDSLAARTPKDGVAVFSVATHTRRRGGTNEMLTGDGLRITANELAAGLGKVRSPMWVALPTCYAGGYAKPGIVGPNRIATFASPSNQQTYQLGRAGSYLIINMVRKGMLEGGGPASVEDAFRFARRTLEREKPNRVPSMSDGIRGELVLGEMPLSVIDRYVAEQRRKRHPSEGEPWTSESTTIESSDRPEPEVDPEAPPEQPDEGSGGGSIGICGRFAANCRR